MYVVAVQRIANTVIFNDAVEKASSTYFEKSAEAE
jgi:hypothetical protein